MGFYNNHTVPKWWAFWSFSFFISLLQSGLSFKGQLKCYPCKKPSLITPAGPFSSLKTVYHWHILFYLYLFALTFTFPSRLFTPVRHCNLEPHLGRYFKTMPWWLNFYQYVDKSYWSFCSEEEKEKKYLIYYICVLET